MKPNIENLKKKIAELETMPPKKKMVIVLERLDFDYSGYTFAKLLEIMSTNEKEANSQGLTNLRITGDLSYENCYYESDSPEMKIEVVGDRLETDEEYSKRIKAIAKDRAQDYAWKKKQLAELLVNPDLVYVTTCNVHPKYLAKRKPKADCEICRKIWADKNN